MATLQDWADFTADYTAAMSEQQTRLNEILNDPDATAEEKAKAREDFARQMLYLQWVTAKNEEVQDSGIVPDVLAIPGMSAGAALYTWAADGKLYPVTINAPQTTGRMSDIFTFATSQHFDIKLRYNRSGTQYDNNVIDHMEYQFPPTGSATGSFGHMGGSGIWTNYFSWTAFDARGNLTDSTGYWNYSNSYAYFPNMGVASASVQPPTITSGSRCRVGSWNGDYQTGGIIGAGYMDVENDPDTVDNPWDYYNDELLPEMDPDNAAFPDGWTNVPVRPDPSAPDFPADTENAGDDIVLPKPENVGAGVNGFLTFYVLTYGQMAKLSQLLYTSFLNDPDYFKNFLPFTMGTTGSVNVSDIMSLFVSMRQYPFTLGALTSYTNVGNMFYIGSGAVGLDFESDLHTVNCMDYLNGGSVSVPFWYGDFRDYQCEIMLYLPYCGTVQLNPADVMGGTLNCTYAVDFCTGACTAYVECTTWDNKHFVIAQLPGQVGADVPLTATSAGQIAARIGGDVLNFAGTALSGAKNVIQGAAGTIGAAMTGNLAGVASEGYGTLIGEWQTLLNVGKQVAGIGARGGVAAPVLGAGRGFSAFNNPEAPVLQVRSPVYSVPDNYPSSVGYPSTEAVTVGACSGFCQFVNVDVSGVTADAHDQAAIKSILEKGIYV